MGGAGTPPRRRQRRRDCRLGALGVHRRDRRRAAGRARTESVRFLAAGGCGPRTCTHSRAAARARAQRRTVGRQRADGSRSSCSSRRGPRDVDGGRAVVGPCGCTPAQHGPAHGSDPAGGTCRTRRVHSATARGTRHRRLPERPPRTDIELGCSARGGDGGNAGDPRPARALAVHTHTDVALLPGATGRPTVRRPAPKLPPRRRHPHRLPFLQPPRQLHSLPRRLSRGPPGHHPQPPISPSRPPPTRPLVAPAPSRSSRARSSRPRRRCGPAAPYGSSGSGSRSTPRS